MQIEKSFTGNSKDMGEDGRNCNEKSPTHVSLRDLQSPNDAVSNGNEIEQIQQTQTS
jgi:hypothetical protein